MLANYRRLARKPLMMLALTALVALISALALPLSLGQFATRSAPMIAPTRPDWGSLPLSFEPNAGQTVPSVHFMAHAPGGTLFFAPSEVVLAMPNAEPRKENAQDAPARDPQLTVLRVQFIGANPSASIEQGEGLPGKVNYLVGNDHTQWHSNLPTYAGVTYTQLYKGVDLAYTGTGGQLKGTYMLAPGADPSQLQWRYTGADKLSIDPQGNLQISISQSAIQLIEQAPIAWQEINGQRVAVSAGYRLAAQGTVAFELGAYNKAYPLTIDPTLVYSTYLGGSAADEAYGIALDSAGNMYVAGLTQSANFPVQGAYQPTYRGGTDAFVTKLNPAGTALVYSTYLGGSGLDQGFAIAVDSAGRAVVTGNTNSTNFPTENPYQPSYGGGAVDSFATQLTANGAALVYSTYLGGSGFDTGQGVAIDTSGNAYIAGLSNSTNFPTVNAYQSTNGGAQDVTVTKLSPNVGVPGYSTYLGGTGDDFGRGIAVDSTGNAYTTGSTASPNFPTQNAYQPACRNNCQFSDTFVSKLNPNGSTLLYSTYIGGNIEEVGYGIAVDAAGNAYATGTTTSLNFPTRNPFQPNFINYIDAYVSKFNTTLSGDASLIYSTYLGGNSTDYGYDIEIDGAGDAYVTGYVNSTNFPVLNPIQPSIAGGADAFVTVFAPGGSTLVYSTYLGGSANDFGRGIALDGAGNTYIAGHTESTDFPTQAPYQPGNAGVRDAFIARIFQQLPATSTPLPATPTNTAIPATSTSTQLPATNTSTPAPSTPTTTPLPTFTNTVVPTSPTPTACSVQFTDVPQTNTFYPFVRCLACKGIVSGYNDGTFKPDNLVTRGQLAKIVSNAGSFTEDPGAQIFEDVPTTQPFYDFINRLTNRGIMSGYTCGSPGEPCGSGNRPYFRPYANATRGQTSKIVANAAMIDTPIPADQQTFEDVQPSYTFWVFIERLASRGIMGGYNCGGPGEPCGRPARAYFRPGNNVTRGQSAKIVAGAFYPDCQTP